MFRTAVIRTSRVAVPAVTRPRHQHQYFVRYQSSQPLDEARIRKERLQARDDLQRDGDARLLTYEDIKPKTESPSTDAYLIDVREPHEVIQGSIPSAVNLPLSTFAESLHLEPATFKEKFGFEKPRKSQEVVFYCRSGVRSSTASDIAKRNGYKNIYNYKGSWLDWIRREGGA